MLKSSCKEVEPLKNKTVGVEIERKYIIEMPDTEVLLKQKSHTSSHIIQTYLISEQGETRRVRRRDFGDTIRYIETVKRRIDGMSSTEIERELSEGEYISLLAEQLDGTRPVIKTRHTFDYLGQIFEIDIYPDWQRTAVMETELPDRDTAVEMPPFINIIKEVTGEKEYSNASMSRSFPKEIL